MKRSTRRRDLHRAMLAKAQAPCHICGKPIDYALPYRLPDGTVNPWSFVADHVDALVHSGNDTLSNKLAAHAHCNSRKSDRPHAAIIRTSGVLG